MIDYIEDRRQYKAWASSINKQEMVLDNLITLAFKGHKQCDEWCPSRDSKDHKAGDEGCFCIRAYFASPTHYEAYKELRLIALEIIALAMLGELLNNKEALCQKKGEKNETRTHTTF